jgi:ABC-type transport system substrate-binding protein
MAMVIVACGDGEDDETPSPAATAAPATAAPATAAPATTAAATAAPATAAPATVAPTPTRQRFIPPVTATPAPTTPPAMMAEGEPVQPRLRVAIAPPISQTTVQFGIGSVQSAQGPMTGMFDTLLHNDRYTEALEGYLAESWEISTDARNWRFVLKQNVPFYRGGQPTGLTMTVDDVIHSYDVNNFTPWQDGNSGQLTPFSFPTPEYFDIISDHEFIWKLDQPSWTWGQDINSDDRRGVISKEHFEAVGWDGYVADPIGTGPFTFLDFEVNQGISMERVVDHYRQTPLFHELAFFYVTEEVTRSAMLYTNEADISEISQVLHEQAISRGFEIAYSTTPSARFFMFIGGMFDPNLQDGYGNCPPAGDDGQPIKAVDYQCAPGRYEIDENTPMRDIRVREALNLAIDRDELNDVFFKGTAVKQTLFNYPQAWSLHQDNWLSYDFDPDRARALLNDAGYPDGFEMEILLPPASPSLPEIGDIMEALVSYFDAIGISAELNPMDWAQLAPYLRERQHSRGIIPSRWGAPVPGDVVGDFRNNVNWRQEWQGHPEVYEFIDKMEAATSWEHLQQLEVEAVNWTYEQQLMIPLFWLTGQVVFNPETVESYESRHIHMGPTRHHEFTVPVYK